MVRLSYQPMKVTILILFFLLNMALPLSARECREEDNQMAWVWPDARHVLSQSTSPNIYLLQARYSKTQKDFTFLGPSPHLITNAKKLTLVFRLQALPDTHELIKTFLARARQWENRNSEVIGLQLDFDSPTGKLKQYSDYISNLRKELPKEYALSLTGLVDWINQSKTFQRDLKASNVTVFYQFYQGSKPSKTIEHVMESLKSYEIPFVVGLLPTQTMTDEQINQLKKNENYKGMICFYGDKR